MPHALGMPLTSAQLAGLEEDVLELVARLAEVAIGYFARDSIASDLKPDGSPVSEADRAVELEARRLLAALTPHFGFAGEETGHSVRLDRSENAQDATGAPGHLDFEKDIESVQEDLLSLDRDVHWLLDPIDGTLPFLAQVPTWSTLLALVENGVPVLGVVSFPALNEVFIASRGNGSRFGKIGEPRSALVSCRARSNHDLDAANVTTGTAQAFACRGMESWYEKLLGRSGRTPQYTDAFGHTRVLKGALDAMVDPIACTHDLAALQVIFEETPGAFASSLHGHVGGRAYARGSLVTAGSIALGEALLQDYWRHMASLPVTSEGPEGSFFDVHGQPVRWSKDTSGWPRAIEVAVSAFKLENPDAVVEDVSVVCEHGRKATAALRNGEHNAPPRLDGFVNVQVRAVVAGGTGQTHGALPTSPVTLVSQALSLALAHSREQLLPPRTEILSLRLQSSGHFGNAAWGTTLRADSFSDAVASLAEAQRETLSRLGGSAGGELKSLKLRLALSSHHRFQCFADGVRQTVSTTQTMLTATATSERGEDDRREASRRLFFPELLAHASIRSEGEALLRHCGEEALELLDAAYAPEDIPYDFLAVDADLLGLILHEAVGHAAEGDLVATGQSGFGERGRFRQGLDIAPPWMDIVVDGSLQNCGYSPVDYEGVPARRKTLVREGRLVEGIHMRETALAAGHVPEGSARAEDATCTSQCRMTSIWIRTGHTRPLPLPGGAIPNGPFPPQLLQAALEGDGTLIPGRRVLYLVGWNGGTASCSNLEFRADVRKVYLLEFETPPKLMRSANFTGIATACFQSARAAYGAHLCRTVGVCGKDGQGVLTSDGGPMILLLGTHDNVRVIGTGDSEE